MVSKGVPWYQIIYLMTIPVTSTYQSLKAMDDTGVVMTPFGDVVTVILVVNSNVVGFLARGNDKN